MKTETHKAFVRSWTDKEVFCEMVEDSGLSVSFARFFSKSDRVMLRVFKNDHLFTGMKLFKGKNIWFNAAMVPGTLSIESHWSKKNRLIQLWNYYVTRKFEIPTE